LLNRHGLAEIMEVMTAFAELCRRHEPDTARDPLDCAEPLSAEEARRTGRPNCTGFVRQQLSNNDLRRRQQPLIFFLPPLSS
jgi:hypothetical protein